MASNAARTFSTVAQRPSNCSRFSASQSARHPPGNRDGRRGKLRQSPKQRAFYDRHLDDLQFIIRAEELRHVESKNGADFPLSKALVNASFPQVKFEKPMRLN